MQLIVKGHHLQLTEAMKEYVAEKIGKHVERILNHPALIVDVELTDTEANKGDDKECRITLSIPKGKTICITEKADDLYKAIDLAKDRLARQMKREIERRRDLRRSGNSDFEPSDFSGYELNEAAVDEE